MSQINNSLFTFVSVKIFSDLLEIAFEKTIDLTKTAYEKTKSTTT